MYSAPGPKTRSLLVTLEVEQQDDIRFILRRHEWPDENANARSFPTKSYLEQLMQRVKSVTWVYRDESRESVDGIERASDYPEQLVIHPTLVRIEVREVVLKLEQLTAEIHTLSSYEERW